MKFKFATYTATVALLAALATPVRLPAQEKPTPHYAVTDLGTLGGTFSNASGINNHSSVVGIASLLGDNSFHAFLWRKGVMIDLGTLEGAAPPAYSWALNVNDNDEVVGFSETPTPDPLGENFCGDSLVCLPFLWRAGVMHPLPTLGGTNGNAVDINDRGEVLGVAETSTPDPGCVPPAILHFEPVSWKNGRVQELSTFPGDPDGGGSALNGPGQILIFSTNCTNTSGHDSLLQRGTLTAFGNLGGLPLAANDINNKGLVVGTLVGAGGSDFEAFIWQTGVARAIGTLSGDATSVANASNDKGQVTGQSCDASGNCRGFLWQDGIMMDLSTLVPADSTLTFFDPTDINSRGEIVGLGFQKSTGEPRGFLLTPTNGEAVGGSALSAASGNIKPKIVLPENVRRALIWQRLGHRYHFPAVGAQGTN